jgi:hypothetical protein
MKKHWTEITVEEFCSHRLLEPVEDKECDICGSIDKFWTDDMGGVLCIDCSHDVYSDYMNEQEYEIAQANERRGY